MNRAIFLDRDGVVNFDVRYCHEPEKIKLKPGFPEGLQAMHKAGFLAVVVTNQGGVALGMYEADAVHACHRKLQELLVPYGEKIDGFYFCPHHQKVQADCSCRKPKPGMFFRAARELDIDITRSYMVGDRISDLEAGKNAGCVQGFLVDSFYYDTHAPKAVAAGFETASTVFDVVKKVLEREG
ncbi:MAG: HAD family hydrolase [Lentisphaeria bacterium]|nr:HAD family hydrolase [Lentisphaeria bacterium]